MKISKYFLAVPALAGLAFLVNLTAPKVTAAVTSALVQIVLPSKPFFGRTSIASRQSMGPDTGTLGISSITLTNYSGTTQQVFIFAPVLSGGGCGAGTVIGGADPSFYALVPGSSTLQLPFPTPMVVGAISGHTCIAGEVTSGGFVDMAVTGFVN